MKPDSNREEALFSAAREISDPDERMAWLRRECDNDLELLARLERLLALADGPDPFFPSDSMPKTGATFALPISEGPGDVIGRYKLLQKIGEGGFGVVFMAEQEEPVRRKVAFKIIKLGMDTRQVVARFEAERQALALMDHPNIAKVLDGGATSTGRPYFVMELIKGIPITQFCDKSRLSIQQRLELFVPVCQAVQHAHQKGIIHRDLKPTNILVALFDGRPVPMVIDFGIAKATQQRLTEKTLYTDFAQMIGTPAYMSPEQAEGSQLDIDTRSDVYSLGVLLYELLTGSPPFADRRLRSAGWAEMRRIILEEEPPRPSTRVSTLTDEQRQDLSRNHREDPKRIGSVLRRELDWIVMKALEKDRNRRYETANGLAMDLNRYLRGDAPEAAPPTWSYQIQKFAKRHRKTVAVAAGFALVLLTASVFATWQAVKATRAERRAETQALIAEAVNNFLVNDILMQRSPMLAGRAPNADMTLDEVVRRAAEKLDGQFPDQPLVEAAIRHIVARVSSELAKGIEAEMHLRRALELFQKHRGPEHADTLKTTQSLGWQLHWNTWPDESEEGRYLLEQAYQGCARTLGMAHEQTINAIRILGTYYGNMRMLRRVDELDLPKVVALAKDTYGETDWLQVCRPPQNLAWARRLQGRHSEAQELNRGVLEWDEGWRRNRGPEALHHIETAFTLFTTASYYPWWWQGDTEAALAIVEQGLAIARPQVGSAFPVDMLLHESAQIQYELGLYDDAIHLLKESIDTLLNQAGSEDKMKRELCLVHAQLHARFGDWAGALQGLDRWGEKGARNLDLLAYGLLMRQLAGRPEGMVEAYQAFWAELRSNPNARPADGNALTLLVVPPSGRDYGQVIDLSGRARATPWTKQLLDGVTLFRQEHYAQAAEKLEPVRRDAWNRRTAVLASYFSAMAQFREGETTEAQAALGKAGELIETLLPPGVLDPECSSGEALEFPSTKNRFWNLAPEHAPEESIPAMALCLVARDEAEKTILGRVTSPPVTRESLAQARERWAPVASMFKQGGQAVRRRDFGRAVDLYRQALDHEFAQVEFLDQFWPMFPYEYAAVLTQANDLEAYRQHCERILSQIVGARPPYARVFFYAPDALSPEQLRRVLDLSQAKASEENAYHPPRPKHWLLWELGMAMYHNGQYAQALKPLELAMQSDSHHCAMGATVYAAMTYHRLGRMTDARRCLTEAEEGYPLLLGPDRREYSPIWHLEVLIERGLDEARKLMGPH